MTEATIPPLALHGWYMLTQFADLQGATDPAPDDKRRVSLGDLAARLDEWSDLGAEGWSGLYHMVGGGHDYLIVHLRSTLEALGEAERALRLHPSSDYLSVASGYLSVVELGLYGHTLGLTKRAEREGIEIGSEDWIALVDEVLTQQLEKDYTQRRLFPRQPPEMPWLCFYPMNKRRNVGQNWYTLGLGERARLMQEHGSTGRKYAGKVSQIISASVGLDAWEWAVTLFAADPIQFKELVTEMRYDEVTSVYGEFGDFWVGRRIPTDELASALGSG
jgi:chlorite dismutase